MKKSPWAMITGASSGIGKACAEKFADAGYSLILLARRLERLEKLALHLQKSHAIETLVLSLDIRDHLALEKSARQHVDKFRQVSCLINNAGLSRDLAPLQSGKIKDWEEMIDTNGPRYLRSKQK
jgi:NADP-dependent 3-hydroxy acid dehydrogenase YdfG